MMVAYVYFKSSQIVICKINNVTNINITDREINGDSSIIFGESQDFIILESDTINLNIGDVIDISNLIDARDFFIKGKDYWYQEQIKKTNDSLALAKSDNNELQCFTVDLQFQLDMLSV